MQEKILKPAVEAMAREGRPYRGILYAGLMITADGPKVIEFNCRFGDPETQALLPRLKSDLLEPLLATVEGGSGPGALGVGPAALRHRGPGVRGLSRGLPDGLPHHRLEEAEAMEDVLVFHAGTRREGGRL